VLRIVEQGTDDEYLPRGQASEKGSPVEWKKRKRAYLAKLAKQVDRGALRVSCADKLHNARAILADYEVQGEDLWQRFTTKSNTLQRWYYGGLARSHTERAWVLLDTGLTRMSRQLAVVVAAVGAHQPYPSAAELARSDHGGDVAQHRLPRSVQLRTRETESRANVRRDRLAEVSILR
jgi:hypothetical protein